ncbi:MAG: tryptophan 2,3-dioxygenase, partial [Bacteroidia bacterium]|nr:tryptophan 2,3-dioxygenase [Bacteroidia bacterium]
MSKEDVYYSDYLGLDKILNAQELESDKVNKHAHDEMLFIIIHQAYELWFKQVIYELGSVMDIFSQKSINDNAPDMQIAVHRLKRIVKILELAVQQVGIIETMTPLDFLDFRDMLRP